MRLGEPGSSSSVAELTHVKIDDIDASTASSTASRCAAPPPGLGVSAFGISIEEFAAEADDYPEHDHDEDGIGGRCSPSAPSSLVKRRSTSPCAAPAPWWSDGEEYPIDPDHIVRVGPGVVRKVLAGPAASACSPSEATPGEASTAAAPCESTSGTLRLRSVASPEAKNLEAISKAIDQHNSNCPFPAAEVRMNPFEVERLGWDQSAACRWCPTPSSAPAASGSSARAISTARASRRSRRSARRSRPLVPGRQQLAQTSSRSRGRGR